MWTPKRILILIGAFALFGASFLVYAYFFGGIDGLAPLPEAYLPGKSPEISLSPPDIGTSDKKLAQAFGAECEELRRPIKLDLMSKGLAIAANQMDIEPDGRVKLHPFSAALFPKGRLDAKYPEINSVQCEVAFITLDRPVTSMQEIGSRKIVAIELSGKRGVTLINNRRTPAKSDDMEVLITNGPLYYEERRNQIWTEGYVKMLDQQTQPHPTQITAKGMELHLAKDTGPNRPKTKTPPAKKGEGVNGVEMLVLHSNVDMHLYVDSSSGFLASADEMGKKADKATAKSVDKAHVIIKTNGPFRYDLTKELAWFDSAAAAAPGAATPGAAAPGAATPGTAATSTDEVLVSRENKVEGVTKYDMLHCDHLEIQFRRKAPKEGVTAREGDKEGPGNDKEIESAIATARSGKEINLNMESENLEAYGVELHFRCPSATTGAQTLLKGNPLHAVKDCHKIKAQELHLIGADKHGNGQRVFAKGPGQIDLYDKLNKKREYPLHAVWKDSLISTKEKEGDQVFDLLTLTNDASFIDDEQGQELNAQRLQVWMIPAPKGTAEKKVLASGAPRQQVHKVEAFERVSARSPDLIVRNTNHLVIRFKNETPSHDRLPEMLPPPLGAETTVNGESATGVAVMPALGAPGAKSDDKSASKTPAKEKDSALGGLIPAPGGKKNKNPIELQANEVVAYVTTMGSKKELQELVTEGSVHVHQDGDSPKDKGIDIKGEMLNLLHDLRGDILYVFGDSRRPAQLQLGELTLVGPKVTINQRDNLAEVEGTGAMELPSNTSFDGGKPTKAGARLTVHWNKDMIFNGKYADFHGGVIALQENASLKCQTLQVTLDKVVSFKEGQKGGQNAKVEKMVCDRKVYIQDETKDAQGKYVQYNRLVGSQLTMDNQEGPIIAAGPGRLYHLALSASENPFVPEGKAAAPAKAPPAVKKTEGQEMRLTRIDFDGRMFSNNKATGRNGKFYDNVEVHHLPAEDPDAAVNADKPGKNGFYLRCDLLDVYTRQDGAKTSQMMKATGKCFFRTEEFFGRSDVVKYDEAQEQVIFEGNPATLFKMREPGADPQEIKGQKILYNRKTGNFQLEGGNLIRGSLEPATPKVIPTALRRGDGESIRETIFETLPRGMVFWHGARLAGHVPLS